MLSERVEQRSDESGPGQALLLACWFQSATMPATSRAAALVPPTNAMLWLEPLQPCTPGEQTIG